MPYLAKSDGPGVLFCFFDIVRRRAASGCKNGYGRTQRLCRLRHLQNLPFGALRFLEDDHAQSDDTRCVEEPGRDHRAH